ncbi:MAG: MXAN_2562 family outer membrane beta-barrel protein [Bradymonadaceae bacterium]
MVSHGYDLWRVAPVGLAGAFALAMVLLGAADVRAESPVQGNVEVQGGPYYPNIDAEFSGDTKPFRENFGGKDSPLLDVTAEYYLWTRHGKLGVGGGFGYVKFKGTNTIEDKQSSSGSSSDSSGDELKIKEKQNFAIFPFRVLVSYRWDYLDEQFGVPLAPKIEAGLDYAVWRVKDDSGSIPTVDGAKARNGVFGWHASAMLEFNLDIVAPQTASRFDVGWGVNDTYLFGGYAIRRLNDFGTGSGFDLSNRSWKVGLAFEF